MNKYVADSSVIVKWLHHEEEQYLEQADRFLQDVRREELVLLAPELAKYEVGNALLFGKRVSVDEARTLLGIFYSLPIQFIPQSLEIASDTYKIAQDLAITYYDASFLAVCEQLGATLITDNIKHHGKSKKVKVIPLKDY